MYGQTDTLPHHRFNVSNVQTGLNMEIDWAAQEK